MMGGAKRRSRKPCETAVRNRRAILMFVIDAEACKWAWFIAHVERILGCSVHIIPQIVHMRMRGCANHVRLRKHQRPPLKQLPGLPTCPRQDMSFDDRRLSA